MTRLRVETATYPNTGKVYAELYYPENELIPIATTEPIYPNREEAVKQSCVMFECWMSLMASELEEQEKPRHEDEA
jgi:hypothetical protein